MSYNQRESHTMKNKLIKALALFVLLISAFFAIDKEQDGPIFDVVDRKKVLSQTIKERKSGKIITTKAKVIKLLDDDQKGDKHQKMIIKAGNHTLLLVHNIDIAKRIPVRVGEQLEVKGEYEWNEKGGLIHWTHRSNNNHPEGWVKYKNKKYN